MNKYPITPRDYEQLSAYLDDNLSLTARKKLENRLRQEPRLAAELDDIRQLRFVLRSLPRYRAPRNFTLSKQMAAVHPVERVAPVFGFVSALASFLFVVVVLFDWVGLGLIRNNEQTAAAPAVALNAPGAVEKELAISTSDANIAPVGSEPLPDELPQAYHLDESDQETPPADTSMKSAAPTPEGEAMMLAQGGENSEQADLYSTGEVISPTMAVKPRMEAQPTATLMPENLLSPATATPQPGAYPEWLEQPTEPTLSWLDPTETEQAEPERETAAPPDAARKALRIVEGMLVFIALVAGGVAILTHRALLS